MSISIYTVAFGVYFTLKLIKTLNENKRQKLKNI